MSKSSDELKPRPTEVKNLSVNSQSVVPQEDTLTHSTTAENHTCLSGELYPQIFRRDVTSQKPMVYSAKNTESELHRIGTYFEIESIEHEPDENEAPAELKIEESEKNEPDNEQLVPTVDSYDPLSESEDSPNTEANALSNPVISKTSSTNKAPKYIVAILILASAIIPLAIIYLLFVDQYMHHIKNPHKVAPTIHSTSHTSPSASSIPPKTSTVASSSPSPSATQSPIYIPQITTEQPIISAPAPIPPITSTTPNIPSLISTPTMMHPVGRPTTLPPIIPPSLISGTPSQAISNISPTSTIPTSNPSSTPIANTSTTPFLTPPGL